MWRASTYVPARPPTMASIPTPSGRSAATVEPNARSRNRATTGKMTSSTRARSCFATSAKSWLTATMPAATTSSLLERTSPRSSAYTSGGTDENSSEAWPELRVFSSTTARAW